MYGGSSIEVSFEDRALTHLLIVITAKLRRHESFIFSWTHDAASGSGRSTIWLDPSSTLLYRFSGNRPASVNPQWIDILMKSANSTGGLVFSKEPT